MHSKFRSWEFFNTNKNFNKLFENPGVHAFVTNDPYIEKILKDRLKISTSTFRLYSGTEITKNFLEEQFLNLSLFSSPESVKIINAEQINSEVLNFLVSEIAIKLDVNIVLFFTKTNKGIVDLFKKSSSNLIELEGPKPWEFNKLLNLFIEDYRLNIDFDGQKFILENIENESSQFIELLGQLKVDFEENKISKEDIKKYLQRSKFDFFELVDLYHRDRRKFFITISRKSLDYDWFRHFSMSFQTHLVKVLNPEEIRSKEKLSKYDQTIISASENENRAKIQNDLELFSSIEILSKGKEEFLKDKIRLEILK